MKFIYAVLLTFVLITGSTIAFAQTAADVHDLVKEGVKLNNEGKFTEAIEKYNEVLKIDPGNIYANYGLGYALFNTDKANDGISYLERVIKANTPLTAEAYDLLGSIYDKGHEPSKAVEAYKAGIKADPKYQRLYYNLGLSYFRDKAYADAENNAIEAIKLDPKHANSQRMYALVCFHQNKRAAALLGFCSFILLEPNTARTAEAFGNIQHILKGGVLKAAPGDKPLPALDANTAALNQGITAAVAEACKKPFTSARDLLTAQLKAIFTTIGQLAEKQTGNDFFRRYLGAYFYRLALSPNMPAFARQVSSSTRESAKWINDHPQQMSDLYSWVKGAERGF